MSTDAQTIESLHQRLTTIERDYRRLRIRSRTLYVLNATFALGAAAVLLMGQTRAAAPAAASTIDAEKFIVRDQKGRARASFGVHESGSVLLTFRDEALRTRCELGIRMGKRGDGSCEYPTIRLFDENEWARLLVSVQPGESGNTDALLNFVGAQADPRVELGIRHNRPSFGLSMGKSGAAIVTQPEGIFLLIGAGDILQGKGGMVMAGAPSDGSRPFLHLSDRLNGPRAAVELLEDGRAQFRTIDKDGRTTWSTPVDEPVD